MGGPRRKKMDVLGLKGGSQLLERSDVVEDVKTSPMRGDDEVFLAGMMAMSSTATVEVPRRVQCPPDRGSEETNSVPRRAVRVFGSPADLRG